MTLQRLSTILIGLSAFATMVGVSGGLFFSLKEAFTRPPGLLYHEPCCEQANNICLAIASGGFIAFCTLLLTSMMIGAWSASK